MPTPTVEQVRAALSAVQDPEIHQPITDLGMVETVDVDASGRVRVVVLLTVAGCPLRDTITRDVTAAFAELITTSGARDKLQHLHSRIDLYYQPPKRAAAYSLLAKLSVSPDGLSRATLLADFERILHQQGDPAPADKRKQLFNQLMRDLENDFYVAEVKSGVFDFASGLIKQWWRKYYA